MNALQARLILIATAIFTLGLAMIFSTTSAELIEGSKGDTHIQLFKQIGYAILGAGLCYAILRKNMDYFLEKSPLYLNLICVLLVLVLLPGIGREVNGSKRWLNLFGFSFQPSDKSAKQCDCFSFQRLFQNGIRLATLDRAKRKISATLGALKQRNGLMTH
ncbi:MAG: FtsW/RodA/SpoVE family cell cycle protein [Parachlamydiaceae bacterium]